MKIKLLYLLSIGIYFTNCNNEPKERPNNGLQEVRLDEKIANKDIIRNPVSASQSLDTVNVAKMEFEGQDFDFGTVKQGTIVKHTFKFKNVGKVPLVITKVHGTCGCTTPEWNKSTIAPNGSDEIKVEFDTKNAVEQQLKVITVDANIYPAQTTLRLRGFVQPTK
jgi:hypothetical protein